MFEKGPATISAPGPHNGWPGHFPTQLSSHDSPQWNPVPFTEPTRLLQPGHQPPLGSAVLPHLSEPWEGGREPFYTLPVEPALYSAQELRRV
jgi:hypothetical protein